MSQTVENKVVEFQFNNKDFEKNVATSMSTLDKLKNALNFDSALKGFDNLDRATKNFDMSSMDKSIEETSSGFSALEAIALGALMRIGQQVTDLGLTMVKSLTVDQISAGFDKYSEKVQAVATMYATGKYTMEDIEGSLANLNDYTDRTSYSFSTLVDNMSKFTAAGVELKDAELSMEGIGNWAALSGITAASGKVNIMAYNLSQAMSQGALLLQDFKSIENVNAATEDFKKNLIDVGLAVGNLERQGERVVVTGTDIEVTTTNLRNTLQKKWVDDKVMLATFKMYADSTTEVGKRALEAAAEARTFEDALGAVNDAVSTSWMKTEEMIFGDYKEATKFWTGLQDYVLALFDKTMTARNELLGGALQNNSWKELDDLFGDLNTSEKTLEERVKSVAEAHNINIDDMIKKYGSFSEVLKTGVIDSEHFAEAFSDYATEIIRSAKAVDGERGAMTDYEKTLRKIAAGGYGDAIEAQRTLNNEGWDGAEMWKEAQLRASDWAYGLESVTDAQLEAVGADREQVRGLRILAEQLRTTGTDVNTWGNTLDKVSGREKLINSFYNTLDAFVHIIETVKEAWSNIFPPLTSEKIYDIISQIETFTEKLMLNDERTDQLRRTFEGLFAILDTVRILISDVFSVALELISDLFGDLDVDILDFTGNLGDNAVALHDWVKEHDPFLKALQVIKDVIEGVVQWIATMVEKLLAIPAVKEVFDWIEEKVTSARDRFIEWAESAEPVQNGFEWIAEKADAAFTAVGNAIDKFMQIPAVANFVEKFSQIVGDAWQAIKNFFSDKETIDGAQEIANNIGSLNDVNLEPFERGPMDIMQRCGEILSAFWDVLKEIYKKAKPIFEKIGEWISDFIKKIGELWSTIKTFVNEHLGSIIAVLISGALVIGILKIASALNVVTSVIRGFADLLSGIGSALKGFGFKERMQGISMVISAIGNLILNVAEMAVAMGALTLADQDKLKNVFEIMKQMISIVGAIMILNNLINKIPGGGGGSTNFEKSLNVNIANGAINQYVQMAGAFLILAEALKELTTVDEEKLEYAFKYFTWIWKTLCPRPLSSLWITMISTRSRPAWAASSLMKFPERCSLALCL